MADLELGEVVRGVKVEIKDPLDDIEEGEVTENRNYSVTGEKPYQCDSCHYSCTAAKDLKRHSYTHTGEKPYQCGSCDYSCTSAGDLKRHMARHK